MPSDPLGSASFLPTDIDEDRAAAHISIREFYLHLSKANRSSAPCPQWLAAYMGFVATWFFCPWSSLSPQLMPETVIATWVGGEVVLLRTMMFHPLKWHLVEWCTFSLRVAKFIPERCQIVTDLWKPKKCAHIYPLFAFGYFLLSRAGILFEEVGWLVSSLGYGVWARGCDKSYTGKAIYYSKQVSYRELAYRFTWVCSEMHGPQRCHPRIASHCWYGFPATHTWPKESCASAHLIG